MSQARFKRPDVAVRDKKLETFNTQLKKIDGEISALRKQIDQNQVSDVTQNERKKLQEQTKEIIKTQADLKNRRNAIHEKVKQLDGNIKRKTAEVNEKLGRKAKYSTTAEVKQRINEIEEAISSGDLTLVDEKRLVKEMQGLNKLNKDLVAVEPIKKSIDSDKAQITSLKEELNQLNPREVSTKFEETQEKLNSLQAKTQGVYDKRQGLFNKRTALYKKRDEIYAQIKKIRADFDGEFKAYKQKLEKERLKREEDQKLSKLLEEKDEKMGKLQEALTHAKLPAFSAEIGAIENALLVLDPTFEKPKRDLFESATKPEPVKKVEDADLVLVNKKEEFTNTAPSKSKKHKKKQQQHQQTNGHSHDFTLEPTLIAALAELEVTVPISQEQVETTVKQLKEKRESYLSQQDEETDKNIEKVEKQLAQLETDYAAKEQQIKEALEAKRAKEKEEQKENAE
ncbi:probable Nuclear segregation protein BFR1 [Zygosaccharomyces bailii]|uniref:ZYBA0S10-03620g1_1 n=1 Tax=Zygosaccharomyces bailii (strain CLIB 213 / ATCC 58445 / CBS 680 / BCRC 21525 / NBRC 1098 / NCYC 1416 / NRRL Y-2227) TaxID=1333698 RepID=A0A8J2T9Y9_ZYGB2|nr:ZYBA0S10-03620g1_1 [Zygosaccharomyces bailii CLIB 213]CDH17044.1 probable Nuclear segregation protein BFR1 [Zygosaccharomyces bailii ISA1307]SJM88303.1 probable Nuclear segregation protein BFR1 [Zygosaccharomyces bailii]